jgi:hypothetical protein
MLESLEHADQANGLATNLPNLNADPRHDEETRLRQRHTMYRHLLASRCIAAPSDSTVSYAEILRKLWQRKEMSPLLVLHRPSSWNAVFPHRATH